MAKNINKVDPNNNDHLQSWGGISIFTIASALAIAYIFVGCSNKNISSQMEQKKFIETFNERKNKNNIDAQLDFRIVRDENDTLVIYDKTSLLSGERIHMLTNQRQDYTQYQQIGDNDLAKFSNGKRDNFLSKKEEKEEEYKFLNNQFEKGMNK